ncbi:hypothetical protein ACFXO9_14900 [Nocardia tengchongensis]|uniref:hypothetical protein n=1 Tax=Nocardia tengchongensis TaxID=2055889 RepID=UPI0036899C22
MNVHFDSTVDWRAVKIASMIDEHIRELLLHVPDPAVAECKIALAATGYAWRDRASKFV